MINSCLQRTPSSSTKRRLENDLENSDEKPLDESSSKRANQSDTETRKDSHLFGWSLTDLFETLKIKMSFFLNEYFRNY